MMQGRWFQTPLYFYKKDLCKVEASSQQLSFNIF